MSYQNRRIPILDPEQLLSYNEAFDFLYQRRDPTIESSESPFAPAVDFEPAEAHRVGRVTFPGVQRKSCSRPPRSTHAGSRLGRYHSPALCREGAGLAQLLRIVFSPLYGGISQRFHDWCEMILYLGISLPMAAWSAVTWCRHAEANIVAIRHLPSLQMLGYLAPACQ